MNKDTSIQHARNLLRQSQLGVLSTHSKANEGYPFGSVSTYMSTVNGDVIFYISDLAQHTQNLLSNNKMCLTLFSDSQQAQSNVDDPNAGARLSILGQATLLEKEVVAPISDRFFTLYPSSQQYQGMHDFAFFKLSTERVRFIGGFGDINWISQQDWQLDTPEWIEDEAGIVSHMNHDHRDAMQLIYQHLLQSESQEIEMLTLTPDGFFMRTDKGKVVFITFDDIAYTSLQVRQQIIKLTNAARAALTDS